MSNFFDNFLKRLKPVDDKYNGEDYMLAEKYLPKDVTDPIPLCMYREARDEDGKPLLTPAGDPVRIPRMDVIVVLAWVIARRGNPDITMDEVAQGINNDNLVEIVNDIWRFWSNASDEVIEQVNESTEFEGETKPVPLE